MTSRFAVFLTLILFLSLTPVHAQNGVARLDVSTIWTSFRMSQTQVTELNQELGLTTGFSPGYTYILNQQNCSNGWFSWSDPFAHDLVATARGSLNLLASYNDVDWRESTGSPASSASTLLSSTGYGTPISLLGYCYQYEYQSGTTTTYYYFLPAATDDGWFDVNNYPTVFEQNGQVVHRDTIVWTRPTISNELVPFLFKNDEGPNAVLIAEYHGRAEDPYVGSAGPDRTDVGAVVLELPHVNAEAIYVAYVCAGPRTAIVQGTWYVLYEDGTYTSLTIDLQDWCLKSVAPDRYFPGPLWGPVVGGPTRVDINGTVQDIWTHVYAVKIPVNPGKTLDELVLYLGDLRGQDVDCYVYMIALTIETAPGQFLLVTGPNTYYVVTQAQLLSMQLQISSYTFDATTGSFQIPTMTVSVQRGENVYISSFDIHFYAVNTSNYYEPVDVTSYVTVNGSAITDTLLSTVATDLQNQGYYTFQNVTVPLEGNQPPVTVEAEVKGQIVVNGTVIGVVGVSREEVLFTQSPLVSVTATVNQTSWNYDNGTATCGLTIRVGWQLNTSVNAYVNSVSVLVLDSAGNVVAERCVYTTDPVTNPLTTPLTITLTTSPDIPSNLDQLTVYVRVSCSYGYVYDLNPQTVSVVYLIPSMKAQTEISGQAVEVSSITLTLTTNLPSTQNPTSYFTSFQAQVVVGTTTLTPTLGDFSWTYDQTNGVWVGTYTWQTSTPVVANSIGVTVTATGSDGITFSINYTYPTGKLLTLSVVSLGVSASSGVTGWIELQVSPSVDGTLTAQVNGNSASIIEVSAGQYTPVSSMVLYAGNPVDIVIQVPVGDDTVYLRFQTSYGVQTYPIIVHVPSLTLTCHVYEVYYQSTGFLFYYSVGSQDSTMTVDLYADGTIDASADALQGATVTLTLEQVGTSNSYSVTLQGTSGTFTVPPGTFTGSYGILQYTIQVSSQYLKSYDGTSTPLTYQDETPYSELSWSYSGYYVTVFVDTINDVLIAQAVPQDDLALEGRYYVSGVDWAYHPGDDLVIYEGTNGYEVVTVSPSMSGTTVQVSLSPVSFTSYSIDEINTSSSSESATVTLITIPYSGTVYVLDVWGSGTETQAVTLTFPSTESVVSDGVLVIVNGQPSYLAEPGGFASVSYAVDMSTGSSPSSASTVVTGVALLAGSYYVFWMNVGSKVLTYLQLSGVQFYGGGYTNNLAVFRFSSPSYVVVDSNGFFFEPSWTSAQYQWDGMTYYNVVESVVYPVNSGLTAIVVANAEDGSPAAAYEVAGSPVKPASIGPTVPAYVFVVSTQSGLVAVEATPDGCTTVGPLPVQVGSGLGLPSMYLFPFSNGDLLLTSTDGTQLYAFARKAVRTVVTAALVTEVKDQNGTSYVILALKAGGWVASVLDVSNGVPTAIHPAAAGPVTVGSSYGTVYFSAVPVGTDVLFVALGDEGQGLGAYVFSGLQEYEVSAVGDRFVLAYEGSTGSWYAMVLDVSVGQNGPVFTPSSSGQIMGLGSGGAVATVVPGSGQGYYVVCLDGSSKKAAAVLTSEDKPAISLTASEVAVSSGGYVDVYYIESTGTPVKVYEDEGSSPGFYGDLLMYSSGGGEVVCYLYDYNGDGIDEVFREAGCVDGVHVIPYVGNTSGPTLSVVFAEIEDGVPMEVGLGELPFGVNVVQMTPSQGVAYEVIVMEPREGSWFLVIYGGSTVGGFSVRLAEDVHRAFVDYDFVAFDVVSGSSAETHVYEIGSSGPVPVVSIEGSLVNDVTESNFHVLVVSTGSGYSVLVVTPIGVYEPLNVVNLGGYTFATVNAALEGENGPVSYVLVIRVSSDGSVDVVGQVEGEVKLARGGVLITSSGRYVLVTPEGVVITDKGVPVAGTFVADVNGKVVVLRYDSEGDFEGESVLGEGDVSGFQVCYVNGEPVAVVSVNGGAEVFLVTSSGVVQPVSRVDGEVTFVVDGIPVIAFLGPDGSIQRVLVELSGGGSSGTNSSSSGNASPVVTPLLVPPLPGVRRRWLRGRS